MENKHYDKLDLDIEDKFVDIGTGVTTLSIARDTSSLTVFNENAISFIRRNEKYDKILFKECIHHIPNINLVFNEIYGNLLDTGSIIIVTRPKNIKMPVFKKFREEFAKSQPDIIIYITSLIKTGFVVNVKKKDYTFTLDKEEWFSMLRNKFMSHSPDFTDEEIKEGLLDIEDKHIEDIFEIKDELIFIKAKKKS